MTDNNEEKPRAVIQEYVDACTVGSVDRLQAIFHPEALMSGFLQGEYYMGSPKPFFDAVQNSPAPDNNGDEYQGKITNVEIAGNTASVTLKEAGFMGTNFTDYFHLVLVDDDWKIVSKTFQQE